MHAVSEGLAKTFELLAATENEAPVDVSLLALDSPHANIRHGAVEALLRRRSQHGQRELVARWQSLDARSLEIIDAHRGRMTQALRDTLVGGEMQLVANACQAILRLHEYDLLPVLLTVVDDPQQRHSELAAATLLELADLLYLELTSPRDYRNRRDPQLVRRNLTVNLEQSVARFNRHGRSEVLEAFLLLAARDNCTLQQILLDPLHGSYKGLVEQLLHSQRVGVMRLLVSFLDDPAAPTAALQTLARRDDAPFVRYLLRRTSSDLSAAASQNLRRLDGLAWCKPREGLLELLDDAAQEAALRLIVASNLKRPEAYRIVEYLARHGTPGGRRAAYEALEQFPGIMPGALLVESLDDPEPQVQAAGVRQLRQRGVPGVLPRLIGMIDTPHDVVREALRETLAEFQFKRFLASYDMLEPAVRATTAPLVRKIDPQYRGQLLDEMDSPARTRRLRAIEIAEAMKAIDDVEPRLLELLSDDDHLVRSEAARVLASSDSPAVRLALDRLLLDRSLLVQETVQASLREIEDRQQAMPEPVAGTAGGDR
jgi:HEAT repeat protein